MNLAGDLVLLMISDKVNDNHKNDNKTLGHLTCLTHSQCVCTLQTILFTMDESTLEAVSQHDDAFEGEMLSDGEDDVPFQRPSTADTDDDEVSVLFLCSFSLLCLYLLHSFVFVLDYRLFA
jgi:hypothetical protein